MKLKAKKEKEFQAVVDSKYAVLKPQSIEAEKQN